MSQVQQNLGRVTPSVYKTELDATKAKLKELEDAAAAAQQSSYDSANYGGG
jgi:hypothetical protein